MAEYLINGEVIDLSQRSRKENDALLSSLIGKKEKIYCLCQNTSLPMHASQRNGKCFVVKAHGTGPSHYYLCRHHSLTPAEAASIGYGLDALRNTSDEELVVRLSTPLKIRAAAILPTQSSFSFPFGIKRNTTNMMTTLGLLHFLWENAKLHEFDLNRPITSLWEKIRRAATDVRPAGIANLKYGISDLLLLPLDASTPNQRDRNFAKLSEAQTRKHRLLFAARLTPTQVEALLKAETEEFSLKTTFGISLSLYKDEAKDLLSQLKTSFGDELTYSSKLGDDLIVLGYAEPNPVKPYAKITSLVAMPVVASHVPYDSKYERTFALKLVAEKRRFRKPLRFDAVRDMQVHPDFIFLDTPMPVVVEVYGMSTDEYLLRKKEKRRIYSSGMYPFVCWEWEAHTCKDLENWLATHPLPI